MIASLKTCLFRVGAAAAMVFAAASVHAQDVKDINIALITPMSGPSMGNQEPAVNSYKIAIEEINRKGIMVAGQKYRFNVKWYDGECKATAGVTAVRAALAQVKPMHFMWAAMCRDRKSVV